MSDIHEWDGTRISLEDLIGILPKRWHESWSPVWYRLFGDAWLVVGYCAESTRQGRARIAGLLRDEVANTKTHTQFTSVVADTMEVIADRLSDGGEWSK